MKRIGLVGAVVFLAVVFSFPQETTTAQAMAPQPDPVPDISSCKVPEDVTKDLPEHLYDQIKFFDNYSWQAFAALICDAKPGQRGVADASNGRDGTGPRVFETFKSAWEVYHPGKVSGWDDYERQSANPCRNAPEGELVLASTSKLFDVSQAGVQGAMFPPLPARRNGTYVRYLTQYNKESFEYIVPTLAATSPSIQFPSRSINIKSAWVEMKDLKPDRFYTRWAWIPRTGGNCEKTKVGLVGLHIVQKTPSRPHWIWSTFEQVDNAPDASACPNLNPGGPYTFNNGDCKDRMPNWAPDNAPDAPPKTPFNVERTEHLINIKTADRNQVYQKLFGAQSAQSKWQYYELVMTQWPIDDVAPGEAGDPAHTFPTTSTSSAFANTVMETFFQKDRKFSCLGCHAEVGADYDFVWSRRLEPEGSRGPGLELLRKTLKNTGLKLH
jgi:hypothetical protein